MAAKYLTSENARRLARAMHCDGVIVIAVDTIPDGSKPFWIGGAASCGRTDEMAARMEKLLQFLLNRKVTYVCPKCGYELNPKKDITDNPRMGNCRNCFFLGTLNKFNIKEF